jgi:hypothetical protein
MRSIAAVLNTGPASLYAHVVNKADIDELIIGRLCGQLVLPEPPGPDRGQSRSARRDRVRRRRNDARRLPTRLAGIEDVWAGCVYAWLCTAETVEGLVCGRGLLGRRPDWEAAHPGQRVPAEDR